MRAAEAVGQLDAVGDVYDLLRSRRMESEDEVAVLRAKLEPGPAPVAQRGPGDEERRDGDVLQAADAFERVLDGLPLRRALGRLGDVLPLAAAAMPGEGAGGRSAVGRGAKNSTTFGPGPPAVLLPDADPQAVARRGAADEDRAGGVRHPLAAIGE